MDGLFSLAKTLFDVNVEPANELAPVFYTRFLLFDISMNLNSLLHNQVWNKDVSFYCVKDSSGSPVAYFYFDPYSRPSEKRGGAWMDEVFSRSRVLSRNGFPVRLPIAHMVCNQTPPVGDKPSLMTFREVISPRHNTMAALPSSSFSCTQIRRTCKGTFM